VPKPPHKPSKGERELVRMLAFSGRTQAEIAGVLGMGIKTLVKHYSEDLKSGPTDIIGKLVNVQMERAMNIPVEIKNEDGDVVGKERPFTDNAAVRSAQFLLERKGGFVKETKLDIRGEAYDEQLRRARQKNVELFEEDDSEEEE